MKIVIKWNFKTLLSDIPRLLLTALSIAGVFAMLTSVGVTMESHMLAVGSENQGLSHVTMLLIQALTLTAFAFTVFVLFSVNLEERKDQYDILRSAGATDRQILGGNLTEAAALDLFGACVGVPAGFLISFVLLKAGQIPLRPEVIFGADVLLRGLLPALLLPPAAMLIASLQTLPRRREPRPPREKREKAPFFTGLLPRLFGTGGTLEHALGRQQRRHRALLVTALIVNFTVLSSVTSGFAVLQSAPEWKIYADIEISFLSGTFFDAATNTPDRKKNEESARFGQAVRALLDDCVREGSVRELSCITDAGYYIVQFDMGDLSPEVAAVEQKPHQRNEVTELYPSVYRLPGERSLIETTVYFLDDGTFDWLMREYGVAYDGRGPVFINVCSVSLDRQYRKTDLLRQIPADGVTVCRPGSEQEELLSMIRDSRQRGYTLPEQAEDLLRACPSAAMPISAVLPVDFDYGFNGLQGNLNNNGALIAPERLRDIFPTSDTEALVDYYYQLRGADRETVNPKLDALDGQYGYSVIRAAFSDGSFHYDSDALLVVDHVEQKTDFLLYLHQIRGFLYGFILMSFVMIGLNIVNIVHMNRVSRRHEYAVLTSVGLGAKQRNGMLFYESFRLTAWTVLLGTALVLLSDYLLYIPFSGALLYENRKLIRAGGFLAAMAPYAWIPALAVLFIFFGFVLSETIVRKRFEKEELTAVLKDDLHE